MNETINAPLSPDEIALAARRLHPATRAMAHVRLALLADPMIRTLVGDAVHELDMIPEGAGLPRIVLSAGTADDDPAELGLWAFVWGASFSQSDAIYSRVRDVMAMPSAGVWEPGDLDVYRPTIGEEHPPVAIVATWWTRTRYC